MYYIYGTLTTTGYGDILPSSKQETLLTILFMAVGVTFHSFIYTHMLQKFRSASSTNNFFNIKNELLRQLRKDNKLFNSTKGQHIYREMLYIIKQHRINGVTIKSRPNFKNVRPFDKNILLQEICERLYRFDTIDFFTMIPRKFWGRYLESMDSHIFMKGNIIIEKGAPSTHFFVIKSGKVMYLMSEEGCKQKPFLEVNSFFGETGLLEGARQRWTVVAKKKTVVYSIEKYKFLHHVFTETEFINSLRIFSNERMQEIEKAERECGRAIRRHDRALTKFEELRKKQIMAVNAQINVIKAKEGKGWA